MLDAVLPDDLFQMLFLIQSIDLDPGEIASRNHADDHTRSDDGKMPDTFIVHGPQRVDCSAFLRDRDGVPGHCISHGGCWSILKCRQQSHHIAAGEYAGQVLVAVNDEDGPDPTPTHDAAHMLNRRVFGRQDRLLALNDLPNFSEGARRAPRWTDVFPAILFEFHALEVATRDYSPDQSVLRHWDMTEAAFNHRTQGVYGAALGSNGDRIARYRFR
jgi:hypothetical protein